MPPDPLPRPLTREDVDTSVIYPSKFGSMQRCVLSGAKLIDPDHEDLPPGPKTIMGTIVHRVLQWARLADPPDEEPRRVLEERFDHEVALMENELVERRATAHMVPLRQTVSTKEWVARKASLYGVGLKWLELDPPKRSRGNGEKRVPAIPTKPVNELPIESDTLRFRGSVDFAQPSPRGGLEIRDHKTGSLFEADEDGELRVKSAYADQLRLYALHFSRASPGIELELYLDGREGTEKVSWDDVSAAEVEEKLKGVLQGLDSGELMTPGREQCRFCDRRHRCPEYLRVAPEWWEGTDPKAGRAPRDIWGTVSSIVEESGDLIEVRLVDAAGRHVCISGLSKIRQLQEVGVGGAVYFFNLEPSGLSFRTPKHPRNFHEHFEGHPTAWAFCAFRTA